MAKYKEILAVAKQLESESVAPKKEENDQPDEFQEEFQCKVSELEDSKINWSFLREVPDYMKCNDCFNIFVHPQLSFLLWKKYLCTLPSSVLVNSLSSNNDMLHIMPFCLLLNLAYKPAICDHRLDSPGTGSH